MRVHIMPQNGYNACISIFLDECGIDETINYYFEYALKLPPGKIIYLVDNLRVNRESNDGRKGTQTRISSCMHLFRAISGYGHRLVIIDCVRTYTDRTALIQADGIISFRRR
jgi:hypothetical protein